MRNHYICLVRENTGANNCYQVSELESKNQSKSKGTKSKVVSIICRIQIINPNLEICFDRLTHDPYS